MTSGYMRCPACKKNFQYADWINGVWEETKAPWKCGHCNSVIVLDDKKGYGLRVATSPANLKIKCPKCGNTDLSKGRGVLDILEKE